MAGMPVTSLRQHHQAFSTRPTKSLLLSLMDKRLASCTLRFDVTSILKPDLSLDDVQWEHSRPLLLTPLLSVIYTETVCTAHHSSQRYFIRPVVRCPVKRTGPCLAMASRSD